MNYVIQAVTSNSCAALLLVTLLLNHRRKHSTGTEDGHLFVMMIISNLMQCVVEAVSIAIDGHVFPGGIQLSMVLNTFLFINNICFAILWSLYARAKIYTQKQKRKPWEYLKFMPALFVVVCVVINLFTPVFFLITEDNVYQRTGIYLAAYVATYFYLAMGTITVFRHREEKEKSMFLPAVIFLFPVCLASVVQLLVPGISLLWSGAAIGLASAYMNLQDESAFTDKLSGLFTRHYLNQYLNTLPERVRDMRHQMLGMMMDVDDFKAINDTYGHLMGDDAIAAVGDILRTAIPEHRYMFRYAGDEFVVIMSIEETRQVEAALERIYAETEKFNATGGRPYHLSLSIGYTTYVPGENPNTFLDRMDARMYRAKRMRKENTPQ